MSSSIWTQCAGDSRLRALRAEPWRVVEAQHQVSTRKLVDSDAEQQLLEQLIDAAKPAREGPAHLHYLLFTPFRYPPLQHGSRFGTRFERGIWYGSESQRTAFSEVAYYRLLFLDGTTADLGLLEVEVTAFQADVRTEKGIDLLDAPFATHERELADPLSYVETQAFGAALRDAGVEVVRYRSARDVEGGINIGVLRMEAFGRRLPRNFEAWRCIATRERVEFVRRGYFGRAMFAFERAEFDLAALG